jgi:hypothetical protein
MKFLSISAAAVLLAQSAFGFAPVSQKATFGVVSPQGNVALAMTKDPLPFFAQSNEQPKSEAASEDEFDSMTLEDEVEVLVQQEVKKTQKISNLRNEKGVEFAPWMNISAEDESKIRQLMKEKAEARRKRQEQEKDVSGNLFYDSQAQELSGTGLNYKIIDGQVELEWATKSEKNTKGFLVKRRAAKTNDYSVIASYKDWGPLVSQGTEGGVYRYLDDTVSPGGWVYRITECDNSGTEADLCQALVEVQTEDEQKAALIAGVGFAVFAVGAVVAGLVLDPYAG